MFHFTILLLVFADMVLTQKTEFSVPDEDSCDLPWALACIDDLTYKMRTPNLSFEYYCSSTNYTINVCLKDILTAEDCIKKYPRHGHYNEWIKPLNASLLKFCSINQGTFDNLNAAHCIQQSFFTCLQHDVNMMGPLGILEVVTAQMVPETCSTLDLKVEECLQYNDAPECKLFVDTLLGLVQAFIDSSPCKDQPAILVPLDTETSNEGMNEGSKDCSEELDFEVLGKCFGPMLVRESKGQMSQGLDRFCESSNETMHCLVDLLINGCTHLPSAYHDWLEILGIIEHGFCGSPKDFPVLHNCWTDYYECFRNSGGFLVLADLFFNQITLETCVRLVDEMESCVLNADVTCHDKLDDIIISLRNQLGQNSLCGHNGFKATTANKSSSLLLLSSSSFLISINALLAIAISAI